MSLPASWLPGSAARPGLQARRHARLPGQFVSNLETRGTTTITTPEALTWANSPLAEASSAWQAIRLRPGIDNPY